MSNPNRESMDRPISSRKKRMLLGGLAGGVVALILIVSLVVGLRKKGESKTKTSILFPLYVYPDAGAWDPLYDAIKSHPKVVFTIVINPASGPVAATQLEESYKQGIQRLNSYGNVRTIGYVSTNYGRRDMNLVIGDAKVYTGWNALATNGSLNMHGIFFDEVMANITDASKQYMPTANQAVKALSEFKPHQLIIHNNGVLPDYPQDSMTDLVIVFEGAYSQYLERQPELASLDRKTRAKRCILIHDLPISQSKDDLRKLVKEASQQAATLFLTDLSKNYYERFGDTLKDFVAAVDAL